MQNRIMVRIDQFLKHTRIFKRRVEAKECLDEGHIFVNDKIAKPSSKVKDGDIIILYLNRYVIKLKAQVSIDGRKIFVGYILLEKKLRLREFLSC